MWIDILEADMPQMIIWPMPISRCVAKIANTQSQNM